MEPTIKCGKHLARNAKLTGSCFDDVCLGEAEFENVNLAKAIVHNANMSDMQISCAQIGGTIFKCIGLPPGSSEKQRPVKFENVDLNHSTLLDCDLSDVKIENCNTEGMTINGIALSDLLQAYNQQNRLETK